MQCEKQQNDLPTGKKPKKECSATPLRVSKENKKRPHQPPLNDAELPHPHRDPLAPSPDRPPLVKDG